MTPLEMADTRSVSSDDDLEIIDLDEGEVTDQSLETLENAELLDQLVESVVRDQKIYLEKMKDPPQSALARPGVLDLMEDPVQHAARPTGLKRLFAFIEEVMNEKDDSDWETESSEDEDDSETDETDQSSSDDETEPKIQTQENLSEEKLEKKSSPDNLDNVERNASYLVVAILLFALVVSTIRTINYFNSVTVIDKSVIIYSTPELPQSLKIVPAEVELPIPESPRQSLFNSLAKISLTPVCQQFSLNRVSRPLNFKNFTFTFGYTVPLVMLDQVLEPKTISGELEIHENCQEKREKKSVKKVKIESPESYIYLLESESTVTVNRKDKNGRVHHEFSIDYRNKETGFQYNYCVKCSVPAEIVMEANRTSVPFSFFYEDESDVCLRASQEFNRQFLSIVFWLLVIFDVVAVTGIVIWILCCKEGIKEYAVELEEKKKEHEEEQPSVMLFM